MTWLVWHATLSTNFPLTSMEGSSAHQLLPVRRGPQQGIQRYHGSIVAAAPRPPRQAEALVGLVPLCGAVHRRPNHRPHPVGDASLIQVPVERRWKFQLDSDKQPSVWRESGSILSHQIVIWNTVQLIPLPLVTEVVPVFLRFLHSIASALDKHLGDGQGLVEKAQAPRRDWPALDGVCCEKGRCHSTQEAGGMWVGHPACLHGNRHQRQQLVRPRIPGKGYYFKLSNK